MKKRTLGLSCFFLALVLCLAACGDSAETPTAGTTTAVTTESTTEATTQATTVFTPQTITEAISAGIPFSTEYNIVKIYGTKTLNGERYRSAQGFATDGTYFYLILKLDKDAGAVIVKTDLQGEEIACSQHLDLGHGNDMTYDSEHHRLVIVHGSSSANKENGNHNGRRLSFVDPDTLELLHTGADILPADFAAGAIAYLPSENKFYLSRGGNLKNTFDCIRISGDYTVEGILDGERASKGIEKSATHSAQGMGTDGTYLYFPMSGKKDNIIVVYTPEGQYVTTFHFPTTAESESLVFVDGKMYLYFNAEIDGEMGAAIVEVTFSVQ